MKRLSNKFVRLLCLHLSGIRLALRPGRGLKAVAAKNTWRNVAGMSSLHCDSKNLPLPRGWYLLSIVLQSTESTHTNPMLRVDYDSEEDLYQSSRIPLNFVRLNRKKHRGVVNISHPVRRMHLDLTMVKSVEFSASHLHLRRIGRLDAGCRMFFHYMVSADGVRALVNKAVRHLKRGGIFQRHRIGSWLYRSYVSRPASGRTYQDWLKRHDPGSIKPSATHAPLVSVLLPVHNTPIHFLKRCLDSVLAQTWENWELCVADDASTDPDVHVVLREYATRDARIRIAWRTRNGHISAASNSALELAQGDYVALLDHDDELHPSALTIVMHAWAVHPQWQMVYTDEDKIDKSGHRFDPYFKPDWNYDLLLGQNFLCHLMLFRRHLLQRVGGFREGLEGAQDWDLVLRCSEQVRPQHIGHVPVVLYHWRVHHGSTAMDVDTKRYATKNARRVLTEHLRRCGTLGKVLNADVPRGRFRIQRMLPNPVPQVSIIIPTRDQASLLRRCVDSILQLSTYPNYEIVLVDNASAQPEALSLLELYARDVRVRVVKDLRPFNYSAINNQAVASCHSELICLLNNDTEVITPGWLEELASHALRVDVGAVGAMLYYGDDTIQHAGVLTGVYGGVAAHAYCGMPHGFQGQMDRARLTQAMSAVTAACLMVRRDRYMEVGGLDEKNLKVAFNDVDFCLRLRSHGYSNIWTPFAELYHYESKSRGYEDTPQKRTRFLIEVKYMRRRWSRLLENDPAYNPNLSLTGILFTPAFPPRYFPSMPASQAESAADSQSDRVPLPEAGGAEACRAEALHES